MRGSNGDTNLVPSIGLAFGRLQAGSTAPSAGLILVEGVHFWQRFGIAHVYEQASEIVTFRSCRWSEVGHPIGNHITRYYVDAADSILFGATNQWVTNGLSDSNIGMVFRSEERRVGKECRSGWLPHH